MPGNNSVHIVFEINGEEVTIEANPNQPLKAARNQALATSGNTGRPMDDWMVQDAQTGVELPIDQKIGSFNFQDGVHLVLALRVGAGG